MEIVLGFGAVVALAVIVWLSQRGGGPKGGVSCR